MNENSTHPETTPSHQTTPVVDGSPAGTPAVPAGPRSRTRNLLIAGGAVVAAALLAGGGIAVGAAIADEGDEDDDRSSASSSAGDDATDDATDDDGADDTTAAAQSGDLGADSAAELSDIIDTAAAAGDGEAVSIEANRDGSWTVQLETSTGDETEVRVPANGAAEVVSTEKAGADDTAPQGVLNPETLDSVVAAALAEVDGRIVDIEIDDDTVSPYDISVLTAEGRTVDLDLDADGKVLSTDRT